jgi:RNA polymerase sigma-70 factor (ECF subfamily)
VVNRSGLDARRERLKRGTTKMATLAAASFSVRQRHVDEGLSVRPRRERRESIASRTSPQESHENLFVLPQFSKDWVLVQRAIGGDPDTRESLFAPYTSRLHGTAFAILRNKEDAEDALQDALCKAFASLGSFQGRASLSTWLTSIVRNEALMALRKKRSRPEASLDESPEGQSDALACVPVDERPDPEQTCAAGEIRALIEKELRRLSPALQSALRLRITKGHSMAELGHSLGISAAAFKSRVSRARRQLADELRRSVVTAASAYSRS